MNTFFEAQVDDGRLLRNVAPEATVTECDEDFILPDYMPEIRRFLRLDARCIPAGTFIGTDRVEFGGQLAYTLYYTDAEGHLTVVPLHSNYEYHLPVGEDTPVSVSTHETVESLSGRPSGPRKLSVRARVRATPKIYVRTEAQAPPKTLAPAEAGELERLLRRRDCLRSISVSSGETAAEVSIPLEGVAAESLRLLGVHCAVMPETARAETDRVLCRGVLFFRMLAEREGRLFSEARRVPFEVELPADGVQGGETVLVHGYTGAAEGQIRPTESGSEILLNAIYTLSAECKSNMPITLTADVYSSALPLRVQKKTCKSERFVCGVTSCFTVDGNAPCKEEDEGGEVMDTATTLLSSAITLLPRRVIVNGEMRSTMLIQREEGGCTAADMTFPFRLEAELPEAVSPEDLCEYTVTPVHSVGKAEKGALSVAVETVLTVSVCHTAEDAVPERIEAAEGGYPRDDVYRIYYPQEGESLWQVGKKYGVPLSSLCEENEIPLQDMEDTDSRQSLDGYAWLSVPSL